MFSKFDSDDISEEAKSDRVFRGKVLKYVLILFILLLLAQQVMYFFIYKDVMTLRLALFMGGFSTFWIWCIYKLYNMDFHREEDN